MADASLPWEPPEDDDPAARAFEALRADVGQLRRDVARVGETVRAVPKADYAKSLGAIARDQAAIADAAKAIASHTGANLSVAFFQAEVARGVEAGLSRPAKLLLDAREALIRVVDHIRAEERAIEDARRRWWWGLLGGGVVLGMIAMLVFVREGLASFPDSWGEALAAHAIGKPSAEAGEQLIEHADPGQWSKIVEGYHLREAGGKVLQDCFVQAVKTEKPVKCTVTMTPEVEAVRRGQGSGS